MPYTCDNDLSGKSVVFVNGFDVCDQFHSVVSDIIKTADKRGDVSRTSFGSKKSLDGREAQCDIGFNILIIKNFGCFQTFNS